MSIELRHLRYAVTAAEHRSLRKAALALNVRQSTLSRRLDQLESLVGVSVFDRRRSGVLPTEHGAAFLRGARRIIDEADLLVAAAQNSASAVAGRLTIGVQTSLSTGHLRATLIDTSDRFPEISIEIAGGTTRSLLADVRGGSVDVAILATLATEWDGPTLALWDERVVAVLPENHLLAPRDALYWTDLNEERFLSSRVDPGPALERILTTQIAQAGRCPQVVRHKVDGRDLKPLVGAGLGIMLTCESSVGERHPGVVYREIRDGLGVSRIGFGAYWRDSNGNPALVDFLQLLRERHPELSTVRADVFPNGYGVTHQSGR